MDDERYRGTDVLPNAVGYGCGIALFLMLATYWTALPGFAVAPTYRWIGGRIVIALGMALLAKAIATLVRTLRKRS